MDSDEFQRLVLLGIAEMVTALGDMAYGGTNFGYINTNYKAVVEEIRTAAMEGRDETTRT